MFDTTNTKLKRNTIMIDSYKGKIKLRGGKMLETRKERITLLKAGISTKNIENLYIVGNDMKIINGNLLYSNESIYE